MAGLQEFSFKHALTRDVAYGSLPARPRAHLTSPVDPGCPRPRARAQSSPRITTGRLGYGRTIPRCCTALTRSARRSVDPPRGARAAQEHLEAAFDLATHPTTRAPSSWLWRSTLHAGHSAETLRWLDKVEASRPDDLLRRRRSAGALASSGSPVSGTGALGANSAVTALEAIRNPLNSRRRWHVARRSRCSPDRGVGALGGGIAVAKRVGDPFAEVNARINLFTFAPRISSRRPGEVLAIVEQAAAAGAVEEAARAVVNWIWSALSFVPVDDI